jgi:hypothetical protein
MRRHKRLEGVCDKSSLVAGRVVVAVADLHEQTRQMDSVDH